MPPDAARESPQEPASRVVSVPVLLPLPLAGSYDYAVPPELSLAPGDFVEVPLGRQRLVGVVWERDPMAHMVEAARLKPVFARLDTPAMSPTMRRFVDWVASYTLSAPGAVLRMAMSVPAALAPAPPPKPVLRPQHARPATTVARRKALAVAEAGAFDSAAALAKAAGVSAGVIGALLKDGALVALSPAVSPPAATCYTARALALSEQQQAAADDLRGAVRRREFSVTLLDGVTGSGKTEVYFEAIGEALAAGRSALVLLPEIALSGEWIERFAARFGRPPALWHSELPAARRRETWWRIANGFEPVVVGARSALFLPLDQLGVIIVDEEHDASFKQEEGVVYHARDMAVVRARLADAPIVLASATPSLETLANVESGRYRRLALPSRHGAAKLPRVAAIDLRTAPPPRQRFLAPSLVDAIRETVARNEQAMLFLNRRGYAPLTLCQACGHRLGCPHCDTWLVEHRLTRRLSCHHCGFASRIPEACPRCHAKDHLVGCGPGVERIAEEAATLFGGARIAVMASDMLLSPGAAADLVRQMAQHEIDLLVGTQMIAKGHNFPDLSLVGVVDADLGLAGGDLRAGERTFQLLHQVAGRAGRGGLEARVLLQTTDPAHPVIEALVAGDRDRFLAAEAMERQACAMPPYARLAALIISGPDAETADRAARLVADAAPDEPDLKILGPAPAPIAVLRGRFRRRFLVRAPRSFPLQSTLASWRGRLRLPSSARLVIDIDPYNFL